MPKPTDTLLTWKEKNHACLELSKVHRETTDGIRVTAMPFYLGYKVINRLTITKVSQQSMKYNISIIFRRKIIVKNIG